MIKQVQPCSSSLVEAVYAGIKIISSLKPTPPPPNLLC
jgi:hypothetical protein